MRLIVTDLDGTLIDHHTYAADDAAPALAAAQAAGVPVVLCSSKTYAEMRALARDLRLAPAPLIVENGGAVWLPSAWDDVPRHSTPRDEGHLLVLGSRAGQLRPLLLQVGAAAGARVRGFSVMTDAEVANRTGLDPDVAALARRREFSEPFVCEDPDVDLAVLDAAARRVGARVTRGGRFFHLLGASDKGTATQRLRAAMPAGTRLLGLGDAPNDLPLLQAVDDPVVIPQPDRGWHPDLVAALPAARRAPHPGPAGWNAAVLEWLG